MSGRLILALPAFLIAIMGVALALAIRAVGWPCAAGIAAAIWGLGWAAAQVAKRCLPQRPRWAIAAITVWTLCPGIAAAAAIAIIVHMNAVFDPDAIGMPALDKEMTRTFFGAIAALFTAMFIKLMDDADEEVVGKRVQSVFHETFIDSQKQVPTAAYPVILGHSPVEKWVFEDALEGVEGWGWRARWRRAGEIATAMADPEEQERVRSYRQSKPTAPKQGDAPITDAQAIQPPPPAD
ncbi:MAG TPA: hypothetical protein DDY79_02795 [Brevundimonas sp.]|nr:hypothetical protein [Brevundimonas sp.]